MLSNRTLAIAAVVILFIPTLGAATPIVVPPVPEQLVEGHTVFTVIEIVVQTTTAQARFAAAVAVLVREYQKTAQASRFPGVLWFNDQYLVNPTESESDFNAFRYPCGGAVMAVNRGDPDPRVAIARIEAGNPGINTDDGTGPTPVVPAGDAGIGADAGSTNHTYDSSWEKPYPGTYYYGESTGPSDPASDYAWVGAHPQDQTFTVDTAPGNPGVSSDGGKAVYSDSTVGSIAGSIDGSNGNRTPPWDYRESYLITDPNDHSWVVDKYNFYTRDSTAGANAHLSDAQAIATAPPATLSSAALDRGESMAPGSQTYANAEEKQDRADTHTAPPAPSTELFPTANGGDLETSYAYPVWVVNMLGSPVFVPDGGNAIKFAGEFVGENCLPFRDLLTQLTAPTNSALCGAALDNGNPQATGGDTDLHLRPGSPVAPYTDDPCMSYMEPSRNGYCYGGQQATDVNGDGQVDKSDCVAMRQGNYVDQAAPLRLYNALLYFKLQDLSVNSGATKDHSDPFASGDTNGCSQEQYWWGPNPPQAATQYPCPNQNDDNEGNSHSFHPSAPTHEEQQPCIPAFAGPNPTNHGGSTYVSGMRAENNGYYQTAAPCDYLHATRDIDLYFSPGGRPFPPVQRKFDIMDLEGSSAPFQDFHDAYPGASP